MIHTWIDFPQNAPVANYPLPEAEVTRYQAWSRTGTPQGVTTVQVGSPEVLNQSGFRKVDVTMRLVNVHDTILLDTVY